jgi:putative oxidoreductase
MLQQLLLHSNSGLLDIALLILRVFIGVCFVVHGLGKLGIVGPGGPNAMEGFAGWLRSLGMPMPHLQARLAMLSEIAGGLLITFGLGMRFGAVICLFTMLVAATIGHRGGGYLITNQPPGNEYAINLAVVMVVLLLTGPGAYSLDQVFFGSM